MRKFFMDLLTENDGKSFCPMRVYGAMLCVPATLALVVAGVWLMVTHQLRVMEFAQAVGLMGGTLMTVFGAGVTLKALTDKPVPQE
jgi:glycerol-3-phosphate acyltransferase PlsY